MKKTFVAFLLIFLFAGSLFFIGWIQFSVPAGKYGVLLSKTNGVNQKTIIPGQFRWQWEKLIPTNSQVFIFDLLPITKTIDTEGILPSASIYSKMFEGSPDFSWKIGLSVTARINPSILPVLVEHYNIRDQNALDKWAESKIKALTDEIGRSIISEALQSPEEYTSITSDPASLSELIKQKISALEQKEIEIIELSSDSIRIPDFALYTIAARSYTEYQQRRNTLVSQAAAVQARDSVTEYLQIERFARWGEVLTKYPILIDFLAVSRQDASEAFKAIKSLH